MNWKRLKKMTPTMTVRSNSVGPTVVLAGFVLAGFALQLTGCGLKGDLYFPEPQTQAEEDAVEAEDSELDSEEQPGGISN